MEVAFSVTRCAKTCKSFDPDPRMIQEAVQKIDQDCIV